MLFPVTVDDLSPTELNSPSSSIFLYNSQRVQYSAEYLPMTD